MLDITTDGIDYFVPDNAAYYKNITNSKNVEVPVSLRECEDGESLLTSGKCFDCEEGTYLLIYSTEPEQCKECQTEKSYCYGRNKVYPKANYWRSSVYSDNFIKCRNELACLGMNPPENNSLGAC